MLDRAHNNVGPMHMCFNTAKSVSIKKILNWLLRVSQFFSAVHQEQRCSVCQERLSLPEQVYHRCSAQQQSTNEKIWIQASVAAWSEVRDKN